MNRFLRPFVMLRRSKRKAVLQVIRKAVIAGDLDTLAAWEVYQREVVWYLVGPYSCGGFESGPSYIEAIASARRQRHLAKLTEIRLQTRRIKGLSA